MHLVALAQTAGLRGGSSGLAKAGVATGLFLGMVS